MTYDEAKNESYSVFFEALKSSSPSIIGYVPKVYWDEIEEPANPEKDKYHVRTSFEEIVCPQVAFFQCEDSNSKRTYGSEGILTLIVNAPSSPANAKRNSELLGAAIRAAFRKPRPNSDLWFRNAKIGSSYKRDHFLRTPVIVEYYYTEVA